MTRVENVKQQVKELSDEELSAFRDWFAGFEAEFWDHQFEADIKAGKLKELAEKSLRDHNAGLSTKL